VAEAILDLRDVPKVEAYRELGSYVETVLAGIDDDVAAMATMSALIHHAFGFLWTGFYRMVTPTLLRVGPYQGTLGCLEISVGAGVCGAAAKERKAIIVRDVSSFPGHITCDARSRSEIVLPVFGPSGGLIAVLDVDSDKLGAFDELDRAGLERVIGWFARHQR
jgi:GAF domain-containing protein